MIGNGFDLAHGLPTKYTDFLNWIVAEVEFYDDLKKQKDELTNSINVTLKIPKNKKRKTEINKRIEKQIQLWECIDNNVWFNYFLQCKMYQKENWIDFEKEISETIKSIDNDMKFGEFDKNTIVKNITNPFFSEYFLEDLEEKKNEQNEKFFELYPNKPISELSKLKEEYEKEHPIESLKCEITYSGLIKILLNDLNRLTRALEIYLTEYVESKERKVKELVYIKELEISHVISFNYSHTYEKKYNVGKNIEYDYIHGEVNINNTIETNNMVLGMDEYLPDDRRNKDIEFIAFKKFYQRIYKGTGCKYKEWVDKIRDEWENETEENKKEIRKCISRGDFNNKKIHKVYIFGHSLDVTDRDILRDLILNDNVHTTIFYPDKEELGRKIANLNIVIEQDELIKRTGGSTKTIEFKQQQEMIPIEKSKDV